MNNTNTLKRFSVIIWNKYKFKFLALAIIIIIIIASSNLIDKIILGE